MDQTTLVDRRVDDGRRLLLQLARDGFDVAAAFWLKPGDGGWWHLHIASKLVDEQGPMAAYRKVQASLKHLTGVSVSLDEVKVIEVDDPVTRDVLKLRKRHSGVEPIRLGGTLLGGTFVEEALIYPPVPKERAEPVTLGKLRLKKAVRQTSRLDDIVAPLSPRESHALEQIVASGVSPAQADYWVRKRRELDVEKADIPAGTVVQAEIAAHWGDKLQDDPNPLLRVEAPDGSQGLTFLHDTEPV